METIWNPLLDSRVLISSHWYKHSSMLTQCQQYEKKNQPEVLFLLFPCKHLIRWKVATLCNNKLETLYIISVHLPA